MGNDFSKGVDSAVSIITGIITGDMTGGLAGDSAPWLAEQIKIQAGDNETARLVAHAILGAVVAELQGNSALSGGAGAVVGEVAADIIRKQLYGKEVKDLTEEEKQTISALSQLASGLAVAAGGGNIGDASAAISSSKNAVENNGENLGFDFFFSESKMKAEYNCYTDDACYNLDDYARQQAILEQAIEIQKGITEPYKEAAELIANIEKTVADFTPIIGDAKAFAEAEDIIDYTIASVGLIPGVGDVVGKLLKEAKAALKVGDTKKASQLVQEAQNKLNALDVGSANKASNTAGKGTSAAGQTNSNATNIVNGTKLNAQLVGQEIAGGHAFDKHVIKQGEFKDLSITTKEQFALHIEKVVSNPTSIKELNNGRLAYWDQSTGTVVIRNPKAKDGGTAFRPTNGRQYFDDLN